MEGKKEEGWREEMGRGGRDGERGRGGEGEAIIVDDLDVDDKEAICYH